MIRSHEIYLPCRFYHLLFFVYIFRYEVPEFQQRVMKMYDQLKDESYWTEVDADKTFNDLQEELLSHCNHAIDNIVNEKMDKLW